MVIIQNKTIAHAISFWIVGIVDPDLCAVQVHSFHFWGLELNFKHKTPISSNNRLNLTMPATLQDACRR